MHKELSLLNKFIRELDSCLIVAEAGSNHNGDLRLGKKLIEAAKECGCDAIKFQAFKTENLVTKNAQKAQYQKGRSSGKNQFQMLKGLELSVKQHKVLVKHADAIGIPIFYSVFDEESADLVEELGISIFKLGSGELTNIPLIKHIAKKAKPLILSTGMATDGEILDAVNAFREEKNGQLILMNCSTGYPCRLEDVNLRRIKYLEDKFGAPCGNSDHTRGILVSILAAALGTVIIEKHFTLDKNLHGPDHRISMNPQEMFRMCRLIRSIEKETVGENGLLEQLKKIGIETSQEAIRLILGREKRMLSEIEKQQRVWARKSVIAAKDINKGEEFVEESLTIKRPEKGIMPKDYRKIIGKKAQLDIKEETPITWDMVG